MAHIDFLLEQQRVLRASDLHLSPGHPPIYRINGEMSPVKASALTHQDIDRLLEEIMTPDQRAELARERDLDFAYELVALRARYRVNAFVGRMGVSAVFRMIPTEVPSAEQLRLPVPILQMLDTKKGLILVTGATGCGKSTTQAALVDHLNKTRPYHIITVEDPIEFVHPSRQSLINQREVGVHTRSFASALKAALREDPDVILLGEMRDLETIELAVTAAETGHLVLGTLHTSTAAKSVDRVINVFDAAQQAQIRTMLAESLRGVVAQCLLRTTENKRVAAYEIMVGTPAISSLIREGKIHQIPTVIQTSKNEGMMLMDEAIQLLIDQGRVAPEEAAKNLTPEMARNFRHAHPTR